jgi:3-deoxy-D-manno-oct-2-ulosonic acid (Kdo) hydroxylase
MTILQTFSSTDLNSDPHGPRTAVEANRIAFFPQCPVILPDVDDQRFMREDLTGMLKLKNLSFHPEVDRITGMDATPAARDRLTVILRKHLQGVHAFLASVAPEWMAGLRTGTCSFRPLQERGRNLPAHASNELIHVDAGAYGATGGDRILRFFANISTDEDRVWTTKGNFSDVLNRFGAKAGLLDDQGKLTARLQKNAMDRGLSLGIKALEALNPLAKVLDTSPYDRAMRQVHNFMKDDEDFKNDATGLQTLRFPPGSGWMVFTDGVTHAAQSGQFALATTMILPRANLRSTAESPYDVLAARMPGQRLGPQ